MTRFVCKELKRRPLLWQKARWVWTEPERSNRVVASVYPGVGRDRGLWIAVVSLGFGLSQVFVSCVDALAYVEKSLAAYERVEEEARAESMAMPKPGQPVRVN